MTKGYSEVFSLFIEHANNFDMFTLWEAQVHNELEYEGDEK